MEGSKLLLHVVEGLNRTFELKELLQKCMEATSIVMDSEASSLMLLDEHTGELHVSVPTGPVKKEISGLSIPKTKGISGWVLKNNTPYITNDVSKSELFWKDLSKDFTTRNIICVPLRDSEENPFGVLQAINKKNNEDFTEKDTVVFESLALHVSMAIERARKYEKMVRQVEDREVLLTEIHHRLKNNLATISALIELDLNDIDDKATKDKMKMTGTRLRSVSEVHSLLYDKNHFGEIDFGNYIQNIINNVDRIFSEPDKDIEIHSSLDEGFVDTNKAMVCGLMVNEILINAFQHAFTDRDDGKIDVKMTINDKKVVNIEISDDGIGVSSEKEEDEPLSKGQYIIQALAKKLKAEITFEQNENEGSTWNIQFE